MHGLLATAAELQPESLAIPALAAGTGGVSASCCALVMRRAFGRAAERGATWPRKAVLVLHGPADLRDSRAVFEDPVEPTA